MHDYYRVFTETQPLRDKLREMQEIVAVKTEELKVKKDELARINERIQ